MTALITIIQHTVLAHLSDGEGRTGYDLDTLPAVLEMLHQDGRIMTNDAGRLMERYWHITPEGLRALASVT